MNMSQIKELVKQMHDWTLPFYTSHMDDDSRDMLVQRAKQIAMTAYTVMTSYEKFVFNSNYALLNVMHHGFINDIDYEPKRLNNRMGNMRFFVDCIKNKEGDETPFYPFYPAFAIVDGKTESYRGYGDMSITVGGELVLYTGESPYDNEGIRIPLPIRKPSDGRNARDFLNLYFSFIVSLCASYYPNENLEEFKTIANSWIDDRDVVPIMWAMMIKGQSIPNPFA
jgi:hypothetical protein